ncbi:uncharacterized protein LOC143018237 isoform X2 [Oratosquilla oratoria]|uniref:uncharacterized protein LOC143018237 isoform X2 n=1 Tax=Oratosquilla oratoria TaxID=337810 RepID=UPI003F76C31D
MATEARQAPVPVVDIGDIKVGKDEPNLEDYRRIGDQLAKSFADLGAVYISNHGIPLEERDRAINTGLDFLALPKSTKMKYLRVGETQHGYTKIGKKESDPRGLATGMYESFNYLMSGDCAWPDDELPHLRKNLNSFMDICGQLSTKIMKCMAATLGLDVDCFSKYHSFRPEINESLFRIIRYSPIHQKEKATRMGAHTDVITLTLLFLDDVGGLQIKNQQGEWLDVVPIPGAILINLGDLMQFWTGDTWIAPLHRVVLPSDEDKQRRRLTLAIFLQPDRGTILESVCGTNRYTFSATEYVDRKLNNPNI